MKQLFSTVFTKTFFDMTDKINRTYTLDSEISDRVFEYSNALKLSQSGFVNAILKAVFNTYTAQQLKPTFEPQPLQLIKPKKTKQ